jgi:Zn finger protein HypA/HybF involved in hydrogenase expression
MSAALDEDAPVEQRKTGIKKLGELVTGAFGGIMEHKEQKAAQEEQRARGTDLEPADDKPQCECGLTFSKIPANASRISCPECGREYKVQ